MADRGKSFAHKARENLSKRHKNTSEVRDVLTGAQYKTWLPQYTSNPDVQKTEIQHQVLAMHDVGQQDTLYGKKQNLRHLDPGMNEILAWGEFDPPVKNDFTTNKTAFQEKNKINKMGVEFISEKQDNFRDPQAKRNVPKKRQIVEYLQEENQTLIKKKIYQNLKDKELMANFSTEYRDQATKNDLEKNRVSKSMHAFYENVTVAGVPRYLPKDPNQSTIVMPQVFKNQQLENKIASAWVTEEIDPTLVRPEPTDERDDELDMMNQKSVLSNQTSSSPNKKVLSAEAQRILEQQQRELNDDQRKELNAKLKDLKLCSRWLPDSSLTTYFGKPAFHAYGNANTKPTAGGTVYGQYMRTFNINPHSGGNCPEFTQIHGRALLGGTV